MKASFYHVKLNVSDVGFYKNFLKFLGFNITAEFSRGFGASDGRASIWVFKTTTKNVRNFNHQHTGLNHLAFRVSSTSEVEKFYKGYLLKNTITVLFAPQEHPRYNNGKGYFAVFFEDPDHIKLEVAYVAE